MLNKNQHINGISNYAEMLLFQHSSDKRGISHAEDETEM